MYKTFSDLKKEWQNSFNAIYTTPSYPSQATYLPKGNFDYRHTNSVNIALIAFVFFLFANAKPLYNQVNINLEQVQTNNALLQKVNTTSGHFVENKGQWSPNVLFMAEGKSLRTWITRNSMVFEQFEAQKNDSRIVESMLESEIKAYAVGLEFIGATNNVSPTTSEPSDIKYHFIKGNDKSKYQSGVKMYSEVIIRNVYEGIDMRYYFEDGEVRYDYIIHPKADPSKIRMEIIGSEGHRIEKGELIIETPINPIVKRDLYAFQKDAVNPESRNKVDVGFRLDGNELRLDVGKYDKSKELIIDPLILLRSRVISDISLNSYIYDMAIDSVGKIYIIGTTNAWSFPVTFGYHKGDTDFIIGKLDEMLNIEWLTFFGSDQNETVPVIDIDNNYLYISGITEGGTLESYPITPYAYYDKVFGSKSNVFTVLSLDGSNVVYSTLLGNQSLGKTSGIKVAANGEIYLIGSAYNQYFNFVWYAPIEFQRPSSGEVEHGFIMCLIPYDSKYFYKFRTLFGGDGNTSIRAFDIDDSGSNVNIYITGTTSSSDTYFKPISYPGVPYDNSNTLGNYRNFVAKLEYEGRRLQIYYNTYFGNFSNYNPSLGSQFVKYTKNAIGEDVIFIAGVTDTTMFNLPDASANKVNSTRVGFLAGFKMYGRGVGDLQYIRTTQNPPAIHPCVPSCGMLEIDYIYSPKISIDEFEPIILNEHINKENISVNLSASNTSEKFTIIASETEASNITISLYTINGNLLKSLNEQLTRGSNTYEMDISTFITGAYFYSIIIDNVPVNSGVFQIVR